MSQHILSAPWLNFWRYTTVFATSASGYILVFRADYGEKDHIFKDLQKGHDNFLNRVFDLKPGEYNYRIGKGRDTTERFREEALQNHFLLGKHNKKNASEADNDVNLIPQHELANILPGYSREGSTKPAMIKATVVNTTKSS